MRLIVFGTGEYFRKYSGFIKDEEIVAFADNDEGKQGSMLDGRLVVSVQDAISYDYDKVLIMSRFMNEMRDQLYGYGVDDEKIWFPYDICGLKSQCLDKKILLISDDLKRSGAQISLLNAAKVLRNCGYDVTMASPLTGPLSEDVYREGIRLVIDRDIAVRTISQTPWMMDFDLIMINTAIPYHLLTERNPKIPVIWWIHECEESYRWVLKDRFSSIHRDNLYTYAVSRPAKEAFEKCNSNVEVSIMPIGVPEALKTGKKWNINDGRLRMLVVGEICSIKGQDILAEALSLLEADECEQIEVKLVGRINKDFPEIINAVESQPVMEMVGEVSKEGIDRLYEESDVLVCPSRMDCLPTVAIEAMTHKLPCIVSSAAGITDCMVNGKDALIFHMGDVGALADQLRWCLENRIDLRHIGEEAYKVYQCNYSMDRLAKSLSDALDKAFNKHENIK